MHYVDMLRLVFGVSGIAEDKCSAHCRKCFLNHVHSIVNGGNRDFCLQRVRRRDLIYDVCM
jgi:hypothetical protein